MPVTVRPSAIEKATLSEKVRVSGMTVAESCQLTHEQDAQTANVESLDSEPESWESYWLRTTQTLDVWPPSRAMEVTNDDFVNT